MPEVTWLPRTGACMRALACHCVVVCARHWRVLLTLPTRLPRIPQDAFVAQQAAAEERHETSHYSGNTVRQSCRNCYPVVARLADTQWDVVRHRRAHVRHLQHVHAEHEMMKANVMSAGGCSGQSAVADTYTRPPQPVSTGWHEAPAAVGSAACLCSSGEPCQTLHTLPWVSCSPLF